MTHIRIYKELRKAIAGCLAVMLLPLLTACEHKDLCYDHPHSANVEVVFDWTEAPDARPATMSLYLYPEDGSEPMRYEFTKREGGTIIVPEGMYDALCVNSDKETHRIQNKERMETFQVTTGDTRSLRGALATRSETAPLARGAEEERSVMEPEALWSDHAERLDIGPASGVKRIVLTPKPRVNTCTVEVRNVENLRHVSALSASVTGMAGGWLAGIDELTTEKVTIPFEVHANEEKTQLSGNLTFFGHCPKETGTHKLMIYALMSDGNTYYFEADVTDQLHDPAQDPTHIVIVIDKLPLPKPVSGGGGLQPTVKDWEEVHISLPMS